MTSVGEAIDAACLERGLRASTRTSYRRFLGSLIGLNTDVATVTPEDLLEALWAIDNPNTRRSTVVAIRSVLGYSIKIPKSIPRRYDLPSEDVLRLALMTSPHEARGLLMMYAGLRLGEACAVTASDLRGDHLRVARQIQLISETGKPTKVVVGPVKTGEADIYVPELLRQVIPALQDMAKPDVVRESLRRAGRKVGIKLNPHMLRHWYATTLLAAGAPAALVSRQLRHSDITVTLRTYQQYDAGTTIDGVFGDPH